MSCAPQPLLLAPCAPTPPLLPPLPLLPSLHQKVEELESWQPGSAAGASSGAPSSCDECSLSEDALVEPFAARNVGARLLLPLLLLPPPEEPKSREKLSDVAGVGPFAGSDVEPSAGTIAGAGAGAGSPECLRAAGVLGGGTSADTLEEAPVEQLLPLADPGKLLAFGGVCSCSPSLILRRGSDSRHDDEPSPKPSRWVTAGMKTRGESGARR